MRVLVAPAAATDLKDAYDFVAKDSAQSADQLLERISEAIGLLTTGIVQGREVQLTNGRTVRGWPVPPFKIYYRTSGSDLHVLRVYHLARRPIER